jgi:hypothetical protein
MFSEQWRQQFIAVYNEMIGAYNANDHKKVAELERKMLDLMRREKDLIRARVATKDVPEADVDAVVEELLVNASRIQTLKVFHERGIHIDPNFYMLGWVLFQADLYRFQRNPQDINLIHLAHNGRTIPNPKTCEFLEMTLQELQRKNAAHLYDVLEHFYSNQPWKLKALSEQDYWVLFFYAFAHAFYA